MCIQELKEMRKVYPIIFASLVSATMYGQSLQRCVFNSTGGSIGTGGVRMILSVGEPVVGMVETAEVGLSQGYLTASKSILNASATGLTDEVSTETGTVYPNPFSSHIMIASDQKDIEVSVYNIMGDEVYSGSYPSSGVDLSHLPSGMYMVKAVAAGRILINTKAIKL
jgi:hypothetical protein